MTTEPLTGAALNRAIAERLGWRVELVDGLQRLYAPNGALIAGEAVITFNGIQIGVDDPVDLWREVPDWANDAGESLALCADIGRKHQWHIEIDPFWYGDGGITEARFTDHDPEAGHFWIFEADGETFALALARLALAALEREKSK